MKYSLLPKTLFSMIFGLCLSAAVFCGAMTEAKATEAAGTGQSSSILQTGGLLEADPNQGIMPLDFTADTEGAKQAIKDALANVRSEADISSFGIPISQLSSLLSQVINDNPQFFYYAGYGYSYNPYTNNVVKATFKYSADIDTVKQQAGAYEAAVQKVLNQVQPSWSDLEKALYINDYLAVNCEYDTTYKKYNAYNVLVEGTAVCQGYALAYQDLMNRLDIPCELVTSNALDHAWNLIRIGNSWYHVDVTWNDPINDLLGRARHQYLLKSTSWFQTPIDAKNTNHQADDYVYSGPAGSSEASDTGYDSYFWNNADNAFYYYNGKWYTNLNNTLKEFTGSSTGLTETRTLKTITDKWYVWGSSSQYWTGAYGGCSIFGSTLYYATPTSIQAMELATGQDVTPAAFTLSDEEKASGYIYGFCITPDGTLRYGIAQSPSVKAARNEFLLHTHSFGSWTITKAATCTEEGEKSQSCSCGLVHKEVIPATGHTYDNGQITKQPSCAEEGVMTYTCTGCNDSYTEPIPKISEHSFGDWEVLTDSTCSKEGTQRRTCSVCRSTEEKTIPVKAHTPDAAATCTTAQTCTVCNTELAPAKGHTPGADATCTAPQTCTSCGTTLASATGHRHTETKTTKPATFVKTGKASVVCSDCGTALSTKTIAKVKCKKGQTYTVGGYKYKIVSAKTNGKGTVAFAGLTKKTAKVTIKDTVTILGAKFKIVQISDRALKNKSFVTSVTIGKNVTTIGKEAFYGTKKLKTMTVKSTKITKVGSSALKNTYAKAKIKVPKSKLKKYKTLFKNKGQKKTVKIY